MNGATLRVMNIASTRFSLSFSVGAVLWVASQLSAADQPGAASQSTMVKPNELALAVPAAVTKKAVVAWKTDGFTGLGLRLRACQCVTSAWWWCRLAPLDADSDKAACLPARSQ